MIDVMDLTRFNIWRDVASVIGLWKSASICFFSLFDYNFIKKRGSY